MSMVRAAPRGVRSLGGAWVSLGVEVLRGVRRVQRPVSWGRGKG
jgi:hypothetical protein